MKISNPRPGIWNPVYGINNIHDLLVDKDIQDVYGENGKSDRDQGQQAFKDVGFRVPVNVLHVCRPFNGG